MVLNYLKYKARYITWNNTRSTSNQGFKVYWMIYCSNYTLKWDFIFQFRKGSSMHIRSAEKNCELCNAHVENQTSILIHANALIICQFHLMNTANWSKPWIISTLFFSFEPFKSNQKKARYTYFVL